MNIIMAGIDFNLANIETRERFALTKLKTEEVYSLFSENSLILGSVIISTCNRCEIYLSCEEDVFINPFELFCEAIDVDFETCADLYHMKEGQEVTRHLCLLTCGVKSQIWGEDQIITQVKNAIASARESGATDSILEVLFRNAVTAAKKVKTTLNLSCRENSVVYKALSVIKADKNIHSVFVIGNGEIGRLMASVLTENGYSATMSLRQYKHGVTIIPNGVSTIEYGKRYELLSEVDAVVSATLSPHYTLVAGEVGEKYPRTWIDLAVPRDIDPKIAELSGATLYDVDILSVDEIEKNHSQQLAQIEAIIQKYIYDFENWYRFKKGLVGV